MNDKVLWQVMDLLRAGRPMGLESALEGALQLIVWVLLSRREAIAAPYRFSNEHLGDQDKVLDTLEALSAASPLYSVAYADIRKRLTPDAARINQALRMIHDLDEKGVLEQLDAPDALLLVDQKRSAVTGMPPEIADLMIRLCELHPEDSFYAPWDFGAQLSARAAANASSTYVEVPTTAGITALVALLRGKSTTVQATDPITKPSAIALGKPVKFDAVASLPPFGIRYAPDAVNDDLYNRFPERTTNGNVLAVRHILSHTERRAVIAVMGSLLFADGAEASLRDHLLRNGFVRAVISMPAGMLINTNIPFSILVLDLQTPSSHVRFVDANRDSSFKEARLKFRTKLLNVEKLVSLALGDEQSDDAINVSTESILANGGNLLPSRYLRNDDDMASERLFAEARTAPLSAVATTIRPLALKREDGGLNVREIGAADLPEFGYIRPPGSTVKVDEDMLGRNAKQFLMPLDIVLIIKGSVCKVGIVPENVPPPGEGGWVAGLSALIVRANPDGPIDPRSLFLQWRKHGKTLLSRAVSGATIPMIKTSELITLPVILPDAQTAHEIQDALAAEAALQTQIDELYQQQKSATKSIWPIEKTSIET